MTEILQRLLEMAARDEGLEPRVISQRTRIPRAVRARHRFWHIAHSSTGCSVSEIARFTGHDHTTVLHGIARHSERLEAEHGEG